ncbi:hypothetical protein HPL003_12720 [Paenibacillus terrae HPL-003]|uniref:Uncharacterized protein n=1 Tax=Paenibacillus terrae (strain HPL-003) TaxID=985665 RepID=G7W459_PAETH|nr:hypothetical protein HPL003_12720 [Paenibacillus terrae HPL-003]
MGRSKGVLQTVLKTPILMLTPPCPRNKLAQFRAEEAKYKDSYKPKHFKAKDYFCRLKCFFF